MKRLGKLEKSILAVSAALIIAGFFGIGLVIYNGIKGYSPFDLPDYEVSIRIKNENMNIRSEGSVRHRGADKVIGALERLGNISKEQSRYGVIIISSSAIPQGHNSDSVYSGDPGDYKTAGFYNTEKKMIVVNDAKNADWTMYHEMGHFVDYNFRQDTRVSDMDSWLKLIETEYPGTGWDLYYSNPQEFFAESFAAYYCKPEWLQKICPETYVIIDGIVEEYNGR